MPRLPGLERLAAGPAQLGRRATPDDFGAGEAAVRGQRAGVIGQLGGVAAEVVEAQERIFAAHETASASLQLSELEIETDQALEAARDDPDDATIEQRVTQGIEKSIGQRAKGLQGRWQEEFRERAMVLQARSGARVRDLVRGKRIDASIAKSTVALDNWANLAARAGADDREDILGRGFEHIGRMEGSGVLSAQQAQTAKSGFLGQFTAGLVQRGRNEDPQGTLEDLRAGRAGFQHMDEAQRQQAIEAMETEIAQDARYAKDQQEADEHKAREAQRQLEEKTTKDLLFAAADGSLTVGMIRENQANISPTTVSQLLNATKRDLNPEAIPQPAEYWRLRTLAANDPAAFLAEKIDPAKVGFNKALQLIEAQAAARKRDPIVTGDTFEGRWQKRLFDMGGLDKEERSRLFIVGEAKLQEFVERTGNRPGPKEEQLIIDDVLLQHTRDTRRFFGMLGERSVVLESAANQPTSPQGVPASERAKIIDTLERARRPVTEGAILALYELGRAQGVAK